MSDAIDRKLSSEERARYLDLAYRKGADAARQEAEIKMSAAITWLAEEDTKLTCALLRYLADEIESNAERFRQGKKQRDSVLEALETGAQKKRGGEASRRLFLGEGYYPARSIG